ncbi:hypothetical protein LCGC14_2861530, partial [marine sediment metagenome]
MEERCLLLLLHFLEKSLRVQLYFPIWRVLQLPVGKEKKSIQAWFEKLNRAGNTVGDGARSVQYFANYIFRTAISNQRVLLFHYKHQY